MNRPKAKHETVKLLSDGASEDPAAGHRSRLTELAEAMDEQHNFRKGQFVKWKAGLRNRKLPAYNEAAVVREVLAEPVFDMCESGRCAASPYFGEPLTLIVGIIDPDDGDLLEFRCDARRFEPTDA